MTATMRAELRWLHSPDLLDLEHDTPADPECFCLLVQAMVGERGTDGSESFGFLVCTPQWLAREVAEAGYVLGRPYIFMARYDYGLLLRVITELCDEAEGPDWATVAARLGRYGLWEREDIKDVTGPPLVLEEPRVQPVAWLDVVA